ncbi:MAG: hypothetical protein ABIK10_00960 [candidate division WOR-3 bacterium]
MSRVFFILILISQILLIGCKGPEDFPINFTSPRWHHQETLNYKITRGNRQIGRLKFLLSFDVNNEVPVYLVYRCSNYERPFDEIFDSAVVCFTRKDFMPLRSYINVSSDFGYYITEAHYLKDKVEIFHETMDGLTRKELPLTGNCYDYVMMFYLLRAADFSKRRIYRFYLVSPPINEKILYVARASKKAKLTVDNQFYECIKVTLTNLYTNDDYYLYYEKAEPRRLIRYQDKRRNLVYDLIPNE